MLRARTARISIALALILGGSAMPAGAAEDRDPVERHLALAPLRVRDLTLPAVTLLGFEPASTAALPRGRWVLELDVSHANNFQVSRNVERYLAQRGGPRRPLSEADAQAILDLPGDAFYLDGEVVSTRLSVLAGVGARTHVGLSVPYFHYTGGSYFDDIVFDFHDAFGFGQAGREYVGNDRWQAIFDLDDDPSNALVLLDAPVAHGWGDPTILVHHALPGDLGGWCFAVEAAYKPALADAGRFLSSGGDDVGVQVIADRAWRRWGLVANASWVHAADFDELPRFDVADPLGVGVTLIRRVGRDARFLLQALAGESVFREATDSGLAELQIQASVGMRWRRANRLYGFAVTENIANFDNTPDIGVHVFAGILLR